MKNIKYLIFLLTLSIKLCSSEQEESLDSHELFQFSDDIINQTILGYSNSEFTPIRIIMPGQSGTYALMEKYAILGYDEDPENDLFTLRKDRILFTFYNVLRPAYTISDQEILVLLQTKFEPWDDSLYFIGKQNEDETFSPYSYQYKGADFNGKSIWQINGYCDDSIE